MFDPQLKFGLYLEYHIVINTLKSPNFGLKVVNISARIIDHRLLIVLCALRLARLYHFCKKLLLSCQNIFRLANFLEFSRIFLVDRRLKLLEESVDGGSLMLGADLGIIHVV